MLFFDAIPMTKVHEVRAGECLSSIAFEHGFFVKTLWEDEHNAALKEKRGDPVVLEPGDSVYIPDKRAKTLPVPTGTVSRFRRLGVPALFKVRLVEADEPRTNLGYTLEVDGQSLSGTTDADGVIARFISPAARAATLVVHAATGEERYSIRLGEVDPLASTRGVQARLHSLGFYRGAIDGLDGPDTRAALRDFQRRHGLPESDTPDDATLTKLREAFGA